MKAHFYIYPFKHSFCSNGANNYISRIVTLDEDMASKIEILNKLKGKASGRFQKFRQLAIDSQLYATGEWGEIWQSKSSYNYKYAVC